jgi:Fe-S cluster biosynthesis and repair protein YggX
MRELALSPNTPNEQKDIEFAQERTKPLHLSEEVFETVSKKTWVDVLMQILKVIIYINLSINKMSLILRVLYLVV